MAAYVLIMDANEVQIKYRHYNIKYVIILCET